jgi:hypothetical protein
VIRNLKNEIVDVVQEKTSRKDVYWDCLSAARSIEALKSWVIVKTIERLQTFAETGHSPDDENSSKDELHLVNNALSLAINEAKGLKYDVKQKSIVMEWKQFEAEETKATLFEN